MNLLKYSENKDMVQKQLRKKFIPLFILGLAILFSCARVTKISKWGDKGSAAQTNGNGNGIFGNDVAPPGPVLPEVQPVVSSKCGSTTSTPRSGYKLVWNDEFNEEQLDTSRRWIIENSGFMNGGNNEAQQYTGARENISIKQEGTPAEGKLYLTALKTPFAPNNKDPDPIKYTAPKIYTRGKAEFHYGQIDVCAKLPKGQGFWPAIWMLPASSIPPASVPTSNHPNSTYQHWNFWPISGEIDIMEMVGGAFKDTPQPTNLQKNIPAGAPTKPTSDSIVYGSLNYGELWPKNGFVYSTYKLPSGTFNDDYHLFSILWEKDKITWYVDNTIFPAVPGSPNFQAAPWVPNTDNPDDQKTSVRTPASLSRQCRDRTNEENPGPTYDKLCPWPFNSYNYYLILNIAIGGDWAREVDDSIFKSPDNNMVVDFARVYQQAE